MFDLYYALKIQLLHRNIFGDYDTLFFQAAY